MSTPSIVPGSSNILLPAQGQAAGGKRQGAGMPDTGAAGERDAAFPDLLARLAPAGETGADLAARAMPADAGVDSTFSGMLSRLVPAGGNPAGAAVRAMSPDAGRDTALPVRIAPAVGTGANSGALDPAALDGPPAIKGGLFPEMLSRLVPANLPAAPLAADTAPPLNGGMAILAAGAGPSTAAAPPPEPSGFMASPEPPEQVRPNLERPAFQLPDLKLTSPRPPAPEQTGKTFSTVTAAPQAGAAEPPPDTGADAPQTPEAPAISALIQSLTSAASSSGTQTGSPAGLIMSPKAAPAAQPRIPAAPAAREAAAGPPPQPEAAIAGEGMPPPLPVTPDGGGDAQDTPPSPPEAAPAPATAPVMPSWPGMVPGSPPPPMAQAPDAGPPQDERPSPLPLSAERLAPQAAAPRTEVKVLHQETHFAPVRPHNIEAPAGHDAPASAAFDDGTGLAVPPVTEAAPAEPAEQTEPAPSAPPALQRESGGLAGTQAPAMGEASAAPPLPQQPPARQLSERIAVELAAPAPASDTPAGGTHPATVIRTLTIQLEPADLGTLTVHLSIKDDGLEVHVEASRRETARMIEDDQKTLSHLLQSAGYRVDALAVQVSDAARTGAAPQGAANPGGQFSALPSGQQQQGSPQPGGQSSGSPQQQPRDGGAQHETRSGNGHDKANADRLGGDVYV
jgi:chemotaxis protein MotD